MSGEMLFEGERARLRQCRHGPMLYLTADQYVGRSLDLYGEYSEGEVALFRQLVKPGQIVIEVGANMGSHTVFFAKAVGPKGAVLALEPQRELLQILCANVALGGLGNVHTYHAAAGRQPGRTTVPRVDYGAEGNFGGVAVGGSAGGEPVPVMPLDAFRLKACHFIKIDVEGMEGEVITGADATIRSQRPVLYLENDRREQSASLIKQLFALDYRLYWHLPRLFNPDNFLGLAENVFGKTISVNMLGLPKESAQTINGFREITSPEDDWRQPASKSASKPASAAR